MNDAHDTRNGKYTDQTGNSVAGLASRAIAVLAERRGDTGAVVSERVLEMLTTAALKTDDSALGGVVTDMIHTGVTAEEIVGNYVPEAARWLGERWVDDGLGFAEVTIGAARLQQVVRRLSPDPRRHSTTNQPGLSVLIAVLPDDHHTLGAVVLASQYRLMGISVRLMLGESSQTIIRAMTSDDYAAVFLSTSSPERLDDVTKFIEKARKMISSELPIVVGGAAAHQGLDLKSITGADYAGSDAREALQSCGLINKTPETAQSMKPV